MKKSFEKKLACDLFGEFFGSLQAPTLTCRSGDFDAAKPVASPKSGASAAAGRESVKWRGLRKPAAAERGGGSAVLGAAGGQGLRWFGGTSLAGGMRTGGV